MGLCAELRNLRDAESAMDSLKRHNRSVNVYTTEAGAWQLSICVEAFQSLLDTIGVLFDCTPEEVTI